MPKSKSESPLTKLVRDGNSEWWILEQKSPKGADPWNKVNSRDFDPDTQAARIQQKEAKDEARRRQKIAEENVIAAAKSLDKDDSFFNSKPKRISSKSSTTPSPNYKSSTTPSPNYTPPPKNELQLPKADGSKLIEDHEERMKKAQIRTQVNLIQKQTKKNNNKLDEWNETKKQARKGNLKAMFKVAKKNVSRKLFGKGGKSIRRSRKQRK